QGLVDGESRLTPIQHWFFDTDIPQRQHWNQALLLEPTVRFEPQRLQQALLAVIEQHDALRLRFTETDDAWQATHQALTNEDVLWQFSVDSLDRCEALFADAQRSLNLQNGPFLRAVLV